MWAPASSWATPSLRMYSRSRSRRACWNRFFPVGLIRSPTITGSRPSSTARTPEDTTVRRFSVGGVKGRGRHLSTRARMCSGVVPQQPPSPWAPRPATASMRAANSSGPMSNTVRPPAVRGSPALGLTTTGTEAQSSSSRTMGSIWAGPRPQLAPRASTPSPSSRATAAGTSPPVSSLPFSP